MDQHRRTHSPISVINTEIQPYLLKIANPNSMAPWKSDEDISFLLVASLDQRIDRYHEKKHGKHEHRENDRPWRQSCGTPQFRNSRPIWTSILYPLASDNSGRKLLSIHSAGSTSCVEFNNCSRAKIYSCHFKKFNDVFPSTHYMPRPPKYVSFLISSSATSY